MKKKAEELKKGDTIAVGGEKLTVANIEISDVGKQGVKKCRIEAEKDSNKIVLIRPSNYPFEVY